MATRSAFTDALVQGLVDWGVEAFVYVPSSHVAPIIRGLHEKNVKSILANREEEAVGIAGGMALADTRSIVVMQDNGFGNALTALTTFTAAYHVSLPIVANTRGGLGEYNAMIHTFSGSVPRVLAASSIHVERVGPSDPEMMWRSTARSACELSHTTHRPIVLLADVMHPAVDELG